VYEREREFNNMRVMMYARDVTINVKSKGWDDSATRGRLMVYNMQK
jgi:hypothetical protein